MVQPRSAPCCQSRICFDCLTQYFNTPNPGETPGYDDLDPDLQLARRMVCFHCRSTDRKHTLSSHPRPSQDVHIFADLLRTKGWVLEDGAPGLDPEMQVRVEAALKCQADVATNAQTFHLDSLYDEEQERIRVERERIRVEQAQLQLRSIALAQGIAEFRASAARRRANGDRSSSENAFFIQYGDEIELVAVNQLEEWQWDRSSDADYEQSSDMED